MSTSRSFINRVFAALAVMSVIGMVVLTVTAFAGFEQPNTTLLLTSLVLVFAAPVAMLLCVRAHAQKCDCRHNHAQSRCPHCLRSSHRCRKSRFVGITDIASAAART